MSESHESETIPHPTHIDLATWINTRFPEYQAAVEEKRNLTIQRADLSANSLQLKDFVSIAAQNLLQRDPSIAAHLQSISSDHRQAIQEAVIELTQNTLEHSFNQESLDWAPCSLIIQTEGNAVDIQLTQTTPVPDAIIKRYQTEDTIQDYVAAGITRRTEGSNIVGGLGSDLIKQLIKEANGKLTVDRKGDDTVFRISVSKN